MLLNLLKKNLTIKYNIISLRNKEAILLLRCNEFLFVAQDFIQIKWVETLNQNIMFIMHH